MKPRGDAVHDDCFDWSSSFASFGRHWRLRSSDPELPRLVGELLPPLSVPTRSTSIDRTISIRRPGSCACGAVHPRADVFGGRRLLFRGTDLNSTRPHVRTLLKLDVAECAPRLVFLHAGAVAWNGVGIVIPGATMSGKTSLVLELLRAGATYLSDEYAVIDGRGRLHPYPQPLGVRVGSTRVQDDQAAERFGAETATASVPVGFVIATKYVKIRQWHPATMSPGHTSLALLQHAVAARRDPARVLAALRRVAERAVGWRGDRGAARATAHAILARIENGAG